MRSLERVSAGAIGSATASLVGLGHDAASLAWVKGSAGAVVAVVSMATVAGTIVGALAQLAARRIPPKIAATAWTCAAAALAMISLWDRPALASPIAKAAAAVLFLAIAILGGALSGGAFSNQLDARRRAAASGVVGVLVVLFAHHPLARLHAGVSLAAFAVAALLFSVMATPIIQARGLGKKLVGPASVILVLALAGALALRDPEVRLVVGAHALLGRDALSLLRPLGLWSEMPSPPHTFAERPSSEQAAGPLPTTPGANVVLLTIDALRADRIGAYGGPPGLTPNLDRFFAKSVVFERAYATYPSTMVSVPSLLTGKMVWGPRQSWRELMRERPGLGALLAPAGYRSVYSSPMLHVLAPDGGLMHLTAAELGFTEDRSSRAPPAKRSAEVLAALDAGDGGARPTFVWSHFPEPHAPYEKHAGFDRGSSDRDLYEAEIAFVDSGLGVLLERLAASNAIVWVTSDHGEAFGERGRRYHASSLFDEQIRVPLALYAPGLAPRRVPGAVSLLDVVPTTLALLGLPARSFDGEDLRARATGRASDGSAFAFFDGRVMHAAGHHKLLCDPKLDACALFDLAANPGETDDIAGRGRPEEGELLARLVGFIAPGADSATSLRRAMAIREAREEVLSSSALAVAVLSSASLDERRAGARALALATSLSDDTAKALRRAREEDADPEVRTWAAVGLAAGTDASDRPAVAKLAAGIGSTELESWVALAKYRVGVPGAADGVRAAIRTTRDARFRVALVSAVRARSDRSLARDLGPILADDDAAEAAARVMVELAPDEAARALPAAVELPHPIEVTQMLLRIFGDLSAVPRGQREGAVAALRGVVDSAAPFAQRSDAALALLRLGVTPPPWLGAVAAPSQPAKSFRLVVKVDGGKGELFVLFLPFRSPGPEGTIANASVNGTALEAAEAEGRRGLRITVPAGVVRAGANDVTIDCPAADLAILGAVLLPVSAAGRKEPPDAAASSESEQRVDERRDR